MSILYFDSLTGAAGDMILGALLDAGAPESELRSNLNLISLGEYQLHISKTVKNGITATKLTVEAPESHHHRHLPDILKMIEDSQLSPAVKTKSKAIFLRLAQAEAKIHGITPEKVHFHEVGAIDSLVDIIGSVIALELLNVEKIYCSPLPLGSGFVQCAHGTIPLPAPATLELLKGVPISETSLRGELVTPTGAAILVSLVDDWRSMPTMTLQATGYGAGTRDFALPNLLRAVIGKPTFDLSSQSLLAQLEKDELCLVEANIDDLNPELYPYILEQLLNQGALDAYWQQIIMKKGRPGCLLSVLTPMERVELISTTIFQETSSIGLRITTVDRYKLPRTFLKVETLYGTITVKLAFNPKSGQLLTMAPEYEDCRLAAQNHQVPLKSVYEAARNAALISKI